MISTSMQYKNECVNVNEMQKYYLKVYMCYASVYMSMYNVPKCKQMCLSLLHIYTSVCLGVSVYACD